MKETLSPSDIALIGRKVVGIGELIQFLVDDSHEAGHFAVGQILQELGQQLIGHADPDGGDS